ncbi:hypothetical protein F5Y01DRAFT_314562 [Xylaria sp. FL0043]|nr:hypothetical protein F5Y01DRAFT_314562 [Xylaria sp. FL0043]
MSTTARKPLPTARPKPVDSDSYQNEVQPTASLAKKRTPLPTLQSKPTPMDESMRRLVAATERIAARRRRQLESINNDDEENQIDPTQSPESEGADGVPDEERQETYREPQYATAPQKPSQEFRVPETNGEKDPQADALQPVRQVVHE